ncbi:MAG: hypothetical protein OXU71_12490 [Gammaproteobacteria bacterium]|nr:hypothetical protein [Gammaproteobacteria bacterium]
MSPEKLISELSRMHKSGALSGEKNAMLVLFGVMYSKEIQDCGVSIDNLAERATGRKGPYIRAGMKLAKYVEVKNEYI